jgi:hypothetical protein
MCVFVLYSPSELTLYRSVLFSIFRAIYISVRTSIFTASRVTFYKYMEGLLVYGIAYYESQGKTRIETRVVGYLLVLNLFVFLSLILIGRKVIITLKVSLPSLLTVCVV